MNKLCLLTLVVAKFNWLSILNMWELLACILFLRKFARNPEICKNVFKNRRVFSSIFLVLFLLSVHEILRLLRSYLSNFEMRLLRVNEEREQKRQRPYKKDAWRAKKAQNKGCIWIMKVKSASLVTIFLLLSASKVGF